MSRTQRSLVLSGVASEKCCCFCWCHMWIEILAYEGKATHWLEQSYARFGKSLLGSHETPPSLPCETDCYSASHSRHVVQEIRRYSSPWELASELNPWATERARLSNVRRHRRFKRGLTVKTEMTKSLQVLRARCMGAINRLTIIPQ